MNLLDLIGNLNRRAFWTMASTLALLYSVFQLNLIMSERARLNEIMQSWSNLNKQKIVEFLFVENELALNGLIESHLTHKSRDKITGIAVLDVDGRVKAKVGSVNLPEKLNPETMYSTGFNALGVNYSTELGLSTRTLGYLVLAANLNTDELLINSIAAILVALIFFGFLISINRSNLRIINNEVVSPILKLEHLLKSGKFEIEQSHRISEIANLYGSYFEMKVRERKLLKQTEEQARQLTASEIARQLAHDIRSPLTALDVAMSNIDQLPEANRVLIKTAVRRIRDLANNLVRRGKSESNYTNQPVYLPSLLDSTISEKRLQYDGSKVTCEFLQKSNVNFCFVSGDSGKLGRVISNLLDNSFHSVESVFEGRIVVVLTNTDRFAEIVIRDNGIGIPQNILTQIGKREVTGRKDGTGLGLLTSIHYVQSLGGSLTITSNEGLGTIVTVRIPFMALPQWFPASIKLGDCDEVICLDDDQSVLDTWQCRFNEIGVSIRKMNNPIDINEVQNREKKFFLIDFEFVGTKTNGLDLIRDYSLQNNSILVTSYFDDRDVLSKAVDAGVKVIPKSFAVSIPISR